VAGIYLHIPFCKSKCAYCDFFSVASTEKREQFVEALCREMQIQKNYLQHEKVQTIYFGGGTPSMLNENQLEKILNNIHQHFNIAEHHEITLEANPDDLSGAYLKGLINAGVNRLSIGIQSFYDDDLLLMRRKHSAKQAVKAVEKAQEAGFRNISIDLIYGLPDLTLERWEQNIKNAMELKIQHISAYHLTIEPKTLFYKYYQNNKIKLPKENESLEQFKRLRDITAKNGFLHYEISNFAKDGFISLHNTNYWMDIKYLGLGPSAHSYNLTARQWNISNLRAYLDGIFQGKMAIEIEKLTTNEKYNEFVITSLRTMWGLKIEMLKNKFEEKYVNEFLKTSKKYLEKNLMQQQMGNFSLTEEGIFISDYIIQDFLIT